MDIGPGSVLREAMREPYWDVISDPWTLAAPGIFRDWARVVSFLMSRAMAVRHWTTASATLSLIGPVYFDVADSLNSTYLELPDFPFDVRVPWGIEQHIMIH